MRIHNVPILCLVSGLAAIRPVRRPSGHTRRHLPSLLVALTLTTVACTTGSASSQSTQSDPPRVPSPTVAVEQEATSTPSPAQVPTAAAHLRLGIASDLGTSVSWGCEDAPEQLTVHVLAAGASVGDTVAVPVARSDDGCVWESDAVDLPVGSVDLSVNDIEVNRDLPADGGWTWVLVSDQLAVDRIDGVHLNLSGDRVGGLSRDPDNGSVTVTAYGVRNGEAVRTTTTLPPGHIPVWVVDRYLNSGDI